MGIGNGIQTLPIGLGHRLLVHQLKHRTRMDIRDIIICLIPFSSLGLHVIHHPIIHFYPFYFFIGDDISAMRGYYLRQQVCKMVTAVHKTTSTIDIQCTNDGMDICRRLMSTSSIQRIHIG